MRILYIVKVKKKQLSHRNKAYLRVHQHKRKLGRQFSSEGTEEKFHLHSVRDDDAKCISLLRLSQAVGRLQIKQ
uniref:Uncharacterized protein n=1 Tax=Anopheles minimus TaxID=112268 RepID=A0A182WA38_9DIPT